VIERLRRRLGRLRVAQRLALLVLVPLVAVVGLAIPVVIDRGYQASAAATVADEARTRRIVGVLLEELQRERLLSLVYLSQAGAEPSPVVRQSQAVNDAIESVRTSADPRLRPGVTALTELLNQVRPRVLDRSVLSLVAHTIFSQGIAAVLDAMPPPRAANETASGPPSTSCCAPTSRPPGSAPPCW
jgi:nitrate/nitrite sensing protein